MLERYDSIDRLTGMGYGQVADTENLFVSSRWLRLEERVSRDKPIYLAVRNKQGSLLSALPCFLLDDRSAGSPFIRLDTFLSGLLPEPVRRDVSGADLAKSALPTLLCGGRRTSHTAAPIRPGLTTSERRAVLTAAVRELDRLTEELGAASTAFLYVAESDHSLRDCLSANGYTEFPSHRNHMLTVPADGFDGYLKSVSKRRAQAIRREERRLDAAGVVAAVERCTSPVIRELAPLQQAHELKYGVTTEVEQLVARHEQAREVFGDDYLVATARTRDGTLRGFTTFIPAGHTIHVREPGREYGWEPSLPIYFQTVFYTPIRHAVAHGFQYIDYSISAEETKKSRGCESQPRFAYVKFAESRRRAPEGTLRTVVRALTDKSRPARETSRTGQPTEG
ncbi:peptidogalycan biosysnthesis protein [Amycolatopsis sp. NPDC058340]|uniref:peptidogalycan biosysnthesis protein n=1 Tax=Amycolatopsis sp. NPDC058340 TaxID=3346453 RepID=UPI0036501E55